MAKEEEEEEEEQLSSTSRSNGNSSSTLLPNWKEYVNLEDVANRYLSEEIIPLQDVAGVQGAKQQNYSEKKLEQKCGTTKQMQQIAAAADNHQNASFDSNTQCHTATDMFNDMHGTSTELVENATNYTGAENKKDLFARCEFLDDMCKKHLSPESSLCLCNFPNNYMHERKGILFS